MPNKTNGVHENPNVREKLTYLRISAGPQRGKYVHRLIAEGLLRRRLKPWETVDHKNQDSLDCDPPNLQVLSWSDHGKVSMARKLKKEDFVEGVDYVVIFDGEKVFEVADESNPSTGGVQEAQGQSVCQTAGEVRGLPEDYLD